MSFGESLQVARKNKGMTQEEVSTLLYVTRQTVSRWEQNKTLPNIHVIKELSRLYDVPINRLISKSEKETERTEIMKTDQINYMALFGSLVFNLFFFSGIAFTIIALVLSLWFIVATFILSPFLLMYVNLSGNQPFDWFNTIAVILLFPTGLILVRYSKKLTLHLINFFKKYYKFNMKTIKQSSV